MLAHLLLVLAGCAVVGSGCRMETVFSHCVLNLALVRSDNYRATTHHVEYTELLFLAAGSFVNDKKKTALLVVVVFLMFAYILMPVRPSTNRRFLRNFFFRARYATSR